MQGPKELNRKNLLDVVRQNLKIVGCNMYVTRFSYVGEYEGRAEDLQQRMGDIVKNLRASYSEIPVTGFMLIYSNYYVHQLEAPEDVIFVHFQQMYENQPGQSCVFGKAIFLPTHHHIYRRFFDDWFSVQAKAPTLLEKLERHSRADVQKQITNCFTKLYYLCDYVSTKRKHGEPLNLNETVPQYLPESTVLQYLLTVQSPLMLSAETYLRTSQAVPFVNYYDDVTWPPPAAQVPSHVLEKYDDQRKRTDDD